MAKVYAKAKKNLLKFYEKTRGVWDYAVGSALSLVSGKYQ